MRIDFSAAVERIRGADSILILTHCNPDGDTLGSGYALLRALRKTGKRVRLINNDTIPEKYAYLYKELSEEDFEPSFIISVDTAEKKLLGDRLCEEYQDRVDLSLDHHEASKYFAKETYCEPGSASACEIIFLIIRALGIELDKDIASCIYTGMSTDTGCFKYSNVTPRTHRIAADVISYGADFAKINEKMFDTKTVGSIKLEKLCYESLELFASGKAALIAVTRDMLRECGVDKSALDAIKPLTRQIEGVSIGITLKQEDNGNTGVSLRTDEDYDAAAICAHFGGGGHIRAAGCEMKCSIPQARERIISYITENVI